MAWTTAVLTLREVVEGTGFRPPPQGSGWLDPRLHCSYCPRLFEPKPPEPDPPPLRLEQGDLLEWERLQAEEAAAADGADGPYGLVSCAKNEKLRVCKGSHGLTSRGRKLILRSGACLRDFPRCLAFWTVTLPDEALIPLLDRGLWPRFQERLRKELVRLLKAAGIPPLVLGVVEIHPRRSKAAGRPLPHVHVVFRGKRNRWHPWAIETWRLDGVIRAALATCDIRGIDLSAAGNIQAVRKDAAAYLAKYLGKGGGHCSMGAERETSPVSCWWFRTRLLKALADAATFQLPVRFFRWLDRNREGLEEERLIRWWAFLLPDPRAPAVYGFRFLGLDAAAAVLGRWLEEEEDRSLWQQTYPNSLWQPST